MTSTESHDPIDAEAAEARDRAAITEWIGTTLGGTVRSIERLRRWRPMWRVDYTANGRPGTVLVRSLRAWESIPYTLKHEMLCLKVLEENGICVPHVHGDMLDQPHAFVLDWAEGGRDPGLVQQATENASAMSDDRWQASLKYMDILAEMHAIPVEQFAHTEAGNPQTAEAIALDHYQRNYDLLEKRNAVDAMIEFFTLWLRRNVPARTSRSFVTGDCGQFLNDGPDITAVLDVEIGHIGDPMHDLACFRGRHPVENMGDVPALFKRYAQASGKPVDIDAIAYHTACFLGLATIGPMLALADKHPGGDFMEAVLQIGFIGRRTLDAMAEIVGVTFEDIRLPEPRVTPMEDMAAEKLSAELSRLPLSANFAEWQRNILLSLPDFLRAMAHYGPWQEQQDLDDAAEILGHRPADVAEADRLMKAHVRQAGPEEDARLIRYFHRKCLRLCRILAGPDASEDHLLFKRVEPILHRRAEFEAQAMAHN